MAIFTAAGAAITSFFAELTWASVGSFLLRTVAAMGLSMLAQKLAGKGQDRGMGVKGQLDRGADLPQSFILGDYATAGALAYANTWGQSGKTPNAYLTQVITLSDLPIQDVTAIWVNGVRQELGAPEDALSPGDSFPGQGGFRPVLAFIDGPAESYLSVKFFDGTQVEAERYLSEYVATDERPWDASAVGVGVAYAIVTARMHGALWPNGFPKFLFEIKGAALYDPSRDSSVGGTGTQRWNSPSTWGGDGDHLPAVQLYNLLRGLSWGRDQVGGAGVDGDVVELGAGLTSLSLRLVGGGGGGGKWATDGGDTIVRLYDGATLVETWTAAGGVAASSGTTEGAVSDLSPSGNGGPGYIDGEDPVLFDGGGAGTFVEVIAHDISALVAPRLEFTVGGGGEGVGRWEIVPGDGNGRAGYAGYVATLSPGAIKREWLYGLQGVTEAQLPAAHWIAQIEKCRRAVDGTDGPEPQYRSAAEVPVGAEISTVIESLLDACNGRLSDAGGIYKLWVGGPGTAVASFADDDILSTRDQSFTPFFGLADTVNGVAARYPSPEAAWQVEAAPPLYRDDLEAEDGNRRLLIDVSLDFVPYPEQVQRVMKAALAEARRARRHTITLPPKFWALEPGDVVAWTSARNGYITKQFRVDGVVDQPNADIVLDLTEVDPADYDFHTDVDFTPPVHPTVLPQPVPAQQVLGFTVKRSSVPDGTGTGRRPAIQAYWNGAVDDVRAVKFQLRIKATGVAVDPARSDDVTDGALLISSGILPATQYEVRARFIPISARRATWTAWASVTTRDIRIGEDDLDDPVWTRIEEADGVNAARIEEVLGEADEMVGLLEGRVVDALGPLDVPVSLTDRVVAAYGPLGVDIPLSDVVARLDTKLDLQIPGQRSLEDAVDIIAQQVGWVFTQLAQTDQRISDAGIVVDPVAGVVRISGVEALDHRVGQAEIRVDGALAAISLRATHAEVNEAIAGAVLDPTQIPYLDDLELRISSAEITLDAQAGAILSKAETLTVSGIDARLITAESDIDSLEGEIALRVTSSEFDAVESRVTSAESILDTFDGAAATQTVIDVRQLTEEVDLSAFDSFNALWQAFLDRETLREGAAFAQSQLRAVVDDGLSAEASARLALAGVVGGNAASFLSVTNALADADQAMVRDVAELQADVGDNAAAILDEVQARADADGAMALSIGALQTTTGENTAALIEVNRVETGSTSALVQAHLSLSGQVNHPVTGLPAAHGEIEQINTVEVGSTSVIVQEFLGLEAQVNDPVSGLPAATGKIQQIETISIDSTSAIVQAHLLLKGAVNDPTTGLAAAHGEIDELNNVSVGSTSALVQAHRSLNAQVNHATTGLPAATGKIQQIETISLGSTSAIVQAHLGLDAQVNDPVTGLPAATGKIEQINSITAGSTSAIVQAHRGLSAQVNDPVTGLAQTRASLGVLQDVVTNPTTGLARQITDLDAAITDPATGLGATAGALDALVVRVEDTEDGVEALAGRTTTLEARSGEDPGNAVPDNAVTSAEVWTIGTGWTLTSPSAVAGIASLGAFRYALTAGSGYGGEVTSDPFVAVEGATYRAAFQAAGAAAGNYRVRGRLRWYDAAGALVISTAISAALETTTGVKSYQAELVAPAGTRTAVLAFAVNRSDTTVAVDVAGPLVQRIDPDLLTTRGTVHDLDAALSTPDTGIAARLGVVEAQAGATASTVTTQSTTIARLDGYAAATYSVQTDVNGHVAGFGLISDIVDGVPVSDFVVSADRFRIASASGTPALAPFVVYTVPTLIDGKLIPPGVYMADATIRSGAITRAKISDRIESDNFVAGVSGILLNFKTGDVEVNDLTVRGDMIAPNAVTSIASDYRAAEYDLAGTSTAWVTLAEIILTTTGAPVDFTAAWEWRIESGGANEVDVRIARGAVAVRSGKEVDEGSSATYSSDSVFAVDRPAAGTHTYRLQARKRVSTAWNVRFRQTYLRGIELRNSN